MLAYYLQVKWVHIAAVLCSGTVFALRGLLVQLSPRAGLAAGAGAARWAMAAPVRYLSYGIDTVLLTAALMLATMLPSAVFANGWLLAKLSLLACYVGLGTVALRRGRSPAVRRACFVAALAVFAAMLAIARTHHPLALPLFAA
jgi:uncharacterized membrane protein SirB2